MQVATRVFADECPFWNMLLTISLWSGPPLSQVINAGRSRQNWMSKIHCDICIVVRKYNSWKLRDVHLFFGVLSHKWIDNIMVKLQLISTVTSYLTNLWSKQWEEHEGTFYFQRNKKPEMWTLFSFSRHRVSRFHHNFVTLRLEFVSLSIKMLQLRTCSLVR